MNKHILIISTIVLYSVVFLSCQNDKKSEIQQDIYNSIFCDLIDSTVTDFRLLKVPAPDDPDTLKPSKNTTMQKSMNLDPLIIRVRDSFIKLKRSDIFSEKFKKQIDSYKINMDVSTEIHEKLDFDLTAIEEDCTKYEFILESDFINNKNSFTNSLNVSGVCTLSNIYFNKNKNIGVFSFSVVYSRLNAIGVIVVVKESNGNWIIDQVIEDWLA